MKKLHKGYCFIVLMVMCFILLLSLDFIESMNNPSQSSDLYFLFNRVMQLRDYVFDNKSILGVFYYYDLNGVGYGSSFFYGYLTLLPLIFIKDFVLFGKLFYMLSFLTLYFGVRAFFKRFSKNFEFISCLFMVSPLIMLLFNVTTLYLNFFAVGLSFFFLARCIDFFRDNKSFLPASLLFFLIINTHVITAFLSVIFCALLCIHYFDRTRIRGYSKFFMVTTLMCSYFTVSFLWHSEGVTNVGVAQNGLVSKYDTQLKDGMIDSFYGTSFFGGISNVVLVLSDKIHGALIITTPLLVCFGLFYFFRSSRSIKTNLNMLLVLITAVLSVHPVWMWLYRRVNILFQFPLRYLFYTYAVFLVLCFRNGISKRIKALLLSTVLVNSLFFGFSSSLATLNTNTAVVGQVGNGEYLSKEFVRNEKTFNKLASSCEFDFKKDGRYTYINVTDDTKKWVLVPKLWYKGYVAETEDGKRLPCRMGYSQFVEFNTEGYIGQVKVYYAHTWWLYTLEVMNYILVFGCFLYIIARKWGRGKDSLKDVVY